ncbi:hypothetical protein TWF718_003779 [Orbilia javanica]|uniref:F-box domain-containing protein n=1 Tax=Orbilia javanica TaxID=47235 RepID=A0AAN8REI5_9PEZI
MAPSTRKRQALMANPVDIPRPSKKRLKSLRPRKYAIHPFVELPSELQLRIMGFCDVKTLSAFSLLSNHFRELSLRVMWETQPVETYIKNFEQLDEHEDLRLAVRHLAIRKQSVPNRSRFSGVAQRLLTRFPKNYFPGLQELTIEYEPVSSDYFVAIMNTLSKYQPNKFKTLNIEVTYRWNPLNNTIVKDPAQNTIVYPTGLTTINLCFGYAGQILKFDPFKVFDANSDTVTTATASLRTWYNHFSLKPCPKVTTLYVQQGGFEKSCGKELAIKFPNTERLILDAPYCGLFWQGTDVGTMMERYVSWGRFPRVKTVEINCIKNMDYGRDPVNFRDSLIRHIRFLAKRWISDGGMPNLEVIQVKMGYLVGRIAPTDYFTLVIEIKETCRVVTTTWFKKLPQEVELEKEEAEKKAIENEQAEGAKADPMEDVVTV